VQRTKGNISFPELVNAASWVANALGVHPNIDEPHMVRGAICRICLKDDRIQCDTIGHLRSDDPKSRELAKMVMGRAREKAEFLFCHHQPGSEIKASSQIDPAREGAIIAHDCVLAVDGMPNHLVPVANETVAILAASQVGLLCDKKTAELGTLTKNSSLDEIQEIVEGVPCSR